MIRSLIVLTLALFAGPVQAQSIVNPDFEDGLTGWTALGPAFQGQPIAAATVTIETVRPIRVGGNYWHGVPYPLGEDGAYLIRSRSGGGTLTSDPFLIRSDDAFFSLRIAGPHDPSRARVELQVAPAVGSQSSYTSVWVVTGRGPAQLQQEVFAIPTALRGRHARVVIVDADADDDSTIAVDAIALSSARPPVFRLPIWGIGDYHTHPQNYMAFGGLNGARTVWGVPGTAFRDYEFIPDLVERDLPACEAGHLGGPSTEFAIDQVEGRLNITTGSNVKKAMEALLHGFSHGSHGAPRFNDFPSFTSGLHYQMHITQIHRAWEGGLRLMTAIAVHNQGVEFLASPLIGGRTNPSRERAVLDAQVCGMRQLAALNHDWMDIAYSPDDARDIISRGKLAVVLGAEFDQLGQLDGFDSAEDEVQYLWDIGIRQVTPIHAVDNRLGGAAVFQPVYNWLNDLLNRGAFNVPERELDKWPRTFFTIREGCPTPQIAGECALYKLEPDQQRAAIVHLLGERPFLHPVTFQWKDVDGMMNARGLTSAGAAYLRSLMTRGMLIGLEHMSQKSVDDTYEVIGQDLDARGRPECAAIGHAAVDSSCFDAAYPFEFSHAQVRRMSLQKRAGKATVEAYLPSEYEMSDSEADFLHRSGGFVGHFVAVEPVEWPGASLPFANDCGGSSKSFATSFMYALRLMGGRGLGLATDFTIIDSVAPRFGPRACWAARNGIDGHASPVGDQYGNEQSDRVHYLGVSIDGGSGDDAIEPYRMGNRVFNYNEDGLAHYGLLPDFLQDLHNIHVPQEAFDALFSSAEQYVQTWEKTQRISGVSRAPFIPKPLPCENVCRGLCPESPNAGAPRAR